MSDRQKIANARREAIRQMINEGMGTVSIAKELGISRQAVWLLMRRHGLDSNTRRHAPLEHNYYFTMRTKRGKVAASQQLGEGNE